MKRLLAFSLLPLSLWMLTGCASVGPVVVRPDGAECREVRKWLGLVYSHDSCRMIRRGPDPLPRVVTPAK